MTEREIQLYENKEMGFKVRTVLNQDKSISMNAEDAAVGFGWIREQNGKQYVRWEKN